MGRCSRHACGDYMCCKKAMWTNMSWFVNQNDPLIERGFKKKVGWEEGWVREDKVVWGNPPLTKELMKDKKTQFDQKMETISRGIMSRSLLDLPTEKSQAEKEEIVKNLKEITEELEKGMSSTSSS